jgi:hypothetical protein
MPDVRRVRERELHEMVAARSGGWFCTARNPRCFFTAASDAEMLAHVAGNQSDLRELPPLPGIVGQEETAA